MSHGGRLLEKGKEKKFSLLSQALFLPLTLCPSVPGSSFLAENGVGAIRSWFMVLPSPPCAAGHAQGVRFLSCPVSPLPPSSLAWSTGSCSVAGRARCPGHYGHVVIPGLSLPRSAGMVDTLVSFPPFPHTPLGQGRRGAVKVRGTGFHYLFFTPVP